MILGVKENLMDNCENLRGKLLDERIGGDIEIFGISLNADEVFPQALPDVPGGRQAFGLR